MSGFDIGPVSVSITQIKQCIIKAGWWFSCDWTLPPHHMIMMLSNIIEDLLYVSVSAEAPSGGALLFLINLQARNLIVQCCFTINQQCQYQPCLKWCCSRVMSMDQHVWSSLNVYWDFSHTQKKYSSRLKPLHIHNMYITFISSIKSN